MALPAAPPETELCWRIEHACFTAWPALHETECQGWLLRAANGLSRRANSANPLASASFDMPAVIAACEKFYRAHDLSVIVRWPSFIGHAFDDHARDLTYRAEGETMVMHAPIDQTHAAADSTVEIATAATEEWFDAMSRLQNHTAEKRHAYRRVVGLISVPAGYALARDAGRVVSVAYGAIHDGLICFESVVTDQDHRGKGHARRMLAALLAWGGAAGAVDVCLQVQADNRNAVALYTGLGLREVYRYRYWREPA